MVSIRHQFSKLVIFAFFLNVKVTIVASSVYVIIVCNVAIHVSFCFHQLSYCWDNASLFRILWNGRCST